MQFTHLIYWWSELDADIVFTVKDCESCLPEIRCKPSKWLVWPVSCETR